MEFDIPRPIGDFVYETTSAWDHHVMDIDYDISQALFLVLDTNFLLRQLPLLRALSIRLLELGHSIPPLFFVLPGVVVDELDYQAKNGVRELATAATTWLQEQIELHVRVGKGVLRAQKEDETVLGNKSWRSLRGRGENDNIILDCCQYFARLSNGQARLLSQDRNLTLKASISGVPVIRVSKEASALEFLREVMPEVDFELLLTTYTHKIADRSTTSSRWAPPQTSNYHNPRLIVQGPSHTPVCSPIDGDDIDMEDISSPASYSHNYSYKDMPAYRRLADDPLGNLVKNLQYHDVLSRAAGAIPFPETPRQTLLRISKSIPPQILYFVSERGEPGYRAGGIRMWSRGDVMVATAALERLFSELSKLDDEKDQDVEAREDRARARKAVVSMVRAFREEEERWRNS